MEPLVAVTADWAIEALLQDLTQTLTPALQILAVEVVGVLLLVFQILLLEAHKALVETADLALL